MARGRPQMSHERQTTKHALQWRRHFDFELVGRAARCGNLYDDDLRRGGNSEGRSAQDEDRCRAQRHLPDEAANAKK